MGLCCRDPWISKKDGRGSQEPQDQMVKVGEGWVDLESVLHAGYWVDK
jgi:hypothetical protein